VYLPKAPSSEEKLLYVDSGRLKLYLVSGISTAILLLGMVLFVKTNPLFIPYTVFSLATILYLACTYLVGILGKDFSLKDHERLVTRWIDKSVSEEIDILLPVCGEPLELLENTWMHVQKLREAHEGKIKVYVLDDSKDVRVASLADRFRFEYICRETNELKKAGNLRNAFTKTYAPFFVILDADFCPRQDLILNMMPYFYNNWKVGIVQSPQFFEIVPNMTVVQKGAASVQELFYRLIQTNRDSFDGAICVGSNAIYRRSALEQFGGTAAIGYSEDVRTGFRLTAVGGIVRYLPINLAKGTTPENWKTFFTQYYRWSMGSLDLMLAKEFWVAPITKMQKICYLSGMGYYLTTGLSVIFAALPSIYLLIFKPESIHWFNLIFSLPSFFLSTLYMKYWMKLPYDLDTLRVRHVSFFAHLFALKDLLLNTLEEWQVTGVKSRSKRYESFAKMYIALSVIIPLIVIFLTYVRILQGFPPETFALLIFFTLFNAYIAIPVIKDL